MKNTAHSAFLELSPSVEGDRDVVCDPLLYSRLTSPSCLQLLKRIRKVIVGEHLFCKINSHVVRLGPHIEKKIV